MYTALLVTISIALLLSCGAEARPDVQKTKKPKHVVPPIECDLRAAEIHLQEFIAKCPANCRATKQPVYGTGIYASISSICNAAIHGGIITNSGGKVIVKKMAGQTVYRGSFANGVSSLTLPRRRESFIVSVGKPKKGVTYPSTLDYTPLHSPSVNIAPPSSPKEAKTPLTTTVLPATTIAEPTMTTPEPTTTPSTPPPTTSTTTTTTTTTVKPRAVPHKVRDAGSSHPYFASVAAASNARQTLSGPRDGSSQAFRGSSTLASRFAPRVIPGPHTQESGSAVRRPAGPPLRPGRVLPSPAERSQQVVQSNPTAL